MMSGPNSSGLSSLLGAMLESYHRLHPKPKSVAEFKDALQLIWSALLEKAIDNTVKDYHKQLQACVSASGGNFKHIIVIIHITDTKMLYVIACH